MGWRHRHFTALVATLLFLQATAANQQDPWRFSDLQCGSAGASRHRCVHRCKAHANNVTKLVLCTTTSSMKRCTCTKVKVELASMTVYDAQGNAVMSRGGFPTLDRLCPSCSPHCSKWLKTGKKRSNKVKRSRWSRKRASCGQTSTGHSSNSSIPTKEKPATRTNSNQDHDGHNHGMKSLPPRADEVRLRSRAKKKMANRDEMTSLEPFGSVWGQGRRAGRARSRSRRPRPTGWRSRGRRGQRRKRSLKELVVRKRQGKLLAGFKLRQSASSSSSSATAESPSALKRRASNWRQRPPQSASGEDELLLAAVALTADSVRQGGEGQYIVDQPMATSDKVRAAKGSHRSWVASEETDADGEEEDVGEEGDAGNAGSQGIDEEATEEIEQNLNDPNGNGGGLNGSQGCSDGDQTSSSSTRCSDDDDGDVEAGANGQDFDNEIEESSGFTPPEMALESCPLVGNETRVCIEECLTADTCEMRLKLNRCTCGGTKVDLEEVWRFNVTLGVAIFFAAPFSQRYGDGYIRECGDCLTFCRQWGAGERREHYVSNFETNCKEMLDIFNAQQTDVDNNTDDSGISNASSSEAPDYPHRPTHPHTLPLPTTASGEGDVSSEDSQEDSYDEDDDEGGASFDEELDNTSTDISGPETGVPTSPNMTNGSGNTTDNGSISDSTLNGESPAGGVNTSTNGTSYDNDKEVSGDGQDDGNAVEDSASSGQGEGDEEEGGGVNDGVGEIGNGDGGISVGDEEGDIGDKDGDRQNGDRDGVIGGGSGVVGDDDISDGDFADEDGDFADEDGDFADEDGDFADEDGDIADGDEEIDDEDGDNGDEDLGDGAKDGKGNGEAREELGELSDGEGQEENEHEEGDGEGGEDEEDDGVVANIDTTDSVNEDKDQDIELTNGGGYGSSISSNGNNNSSISNSSNASDNTNSFLRVGSDSTDSAENLNDSENDEESDGDFDDEVDGKPGTFTDQVRASSSPTPNGSSSSLSENSPSPGNTSLNVSSSPFGAVQGSVSLGRPVNTSQVNVPTNRGGKGAPKELDEWSSSYSREEDVGSSADYREDEDYLDDYDNEGGGSYATDEEVYEDDEEEENFLDKDEDDDMYQVGRAFISPLTLRFGGQAGQHRRGRQNIRQSLL